VVLVGISAGAGLGLLAYCQNRDVANFISICGFTQLSSEDRANSAFMRLGWYKAADAAEREAQKLSPARKAQILSLYGYSDKVIEIERQRIEGAQNFQMLSRGHLVSIVVALVLYRRRISRFVASKGSE
jgi:hypothetical protein